MQTGRKFGMITMNDALLKLVKDGVVEPREAYMKALDKHNLLTAFKGQEISTGFLSEGETPI
jgi:Tfp pilus assembly pilus retraction ATPase PilT